MAVNTKADEDTIHAISERWKQMVNTHDSAGIAALYADDGVEWPPNVPGAKGHDAVMKSWAGFFGMAKDVKLDFTATDLDVAKAGDMAVERGTYRVTWTDKKGKAMSDKGNYVTTWKKVNGQWKVYADINASEMPMPGM